MKFTFGTVTDRGLNPKRAANEDRFLVLEERGLFLVADGVGGRRGGQVASQTVVDVFAETFAGPPKLDVRLALEAAIVEANRRVFQKSIASADLEGMATTIVALAVDGRGVVIGHVGDSRLYRFEGGLLSALTEDHSEVVEAVRAGIISAAMAAYDPMRNVLTRAVGAEPDVEADFKTVSLTDGVRFLLCSDGVTRHISDKNLEEILASPFHPARICEVLKQRCYAAGAEDNLTAIVVDFGELRYLNAEAPSAESPNATAQGTRIEVDFRVPVETTNAPADRAENVRTKQSSPPRNKSGTAGRVLRNGFVLLALVILGIAIGRYYDSARSWMTQGWSGLDSSDRPGRVGVSPPAVDPDLAAARVLFDEKRFDKARDQLTELKRRSPENAEYHFWHGLAEYEL